MLVRQQVHESMTHAKVFTARNLATPVIGTLLELRRSARKAGAPGNLPVDTRPLMAVKLYMLRDPIPSRRTWTVQAPFRAR